MRILASVILAASSVFAYEVTSPGGTQGWTTVGPNYLTWNRVDTDPHNFTAVLTNMNAQAMPNGPQILDALIDGTLGKIICNPPSAGWPIGSSFRVNLAQDAQHIDSLLAQSGEFSITAPSTTIGATTSSTTPQVTDSSTTTPAPYIPGVSSSDTSTTPTGTSAAALGADTQTGLFVSFAALTALITTLF